MQDPEGTDPRNTGFDKIRHLLAYSAFSVATYHSFLIGYPELRSTPLGLSLENWVNKLLGSNPNLIEKGIFDKQVSGDLKANAMGCEIGLAMIQEAYNYPGGESLKLLFSKLNQGIFSNN